MSNKISKNRNIYRNVTRNSICFNNNSMHKYIIRYVTIIYNNLTNY